PGMPRASLRVALPIFSWSEIQIMALCRVPTVLAAAWLAKDLPPADLDDVSSRSIGLNLPVYRIAVFFVAAVLTSIAVAFVGGVGDRKSTRLHSGHVTT